jgi:hypothetical protein
MTREIIRKVSSKALVGVLGDKGLGSLILRTRTTSTINNRVEVYFSEYVGSQVLSKVVQDLWRIQEAITQGYIKPGHMTDKEIKIQRRRRERDIEEVEWQKKREAEESEVNIYTKVRS